jgi:predicted porin
MNRISTASANLDLYGSINMGVAYDSEAGEQGGSPLALSDKAYANTAGANFKAPVGSDGAEVAAQLEFRFNPLNPADRIHPHVATIGLTHPDVGTVTAGVRPSSPFRAMTRDHAGGDTAAGAFGDPGATASEKYPIAVGLKTKAFQSSALPASAKLSVAIGLALPHPEAPVGGGSAAVTYTSGNWTVNVGGAQSSITGDHAVAVSATHKDKRGTEYTGIAAHNITAEKTSLTVSTKQVLDNDSWVVARLNATRQAGEFQLNAGAGYHHRLSENTTLFASVGAQFSPSGDHQQRADFGLRIEL